MSKQITVTDHKQINDAAMWVSRWLHKGLEGGRKVIVLLQHESRSQAQNRLMWPLLECLALQKDFAGKKFIKEDWKMIMMSAYKSDQSKMIFGINGEIVNLSLSSSMLSKTEFSEFIELIWAQGAEWSIDFSPKAKHVYENWRTMY